MLSQLRKIGVSITCKMPELLFYCMANEQLQSTSMQQISNYVSIIQKQMQPIIQMASPKAEGGAPFDVCTILMPHSGG